MRSTLALVALFLAGLTAGAWLLLSPDKPSQAPSVAPGKAKARAPARPRAAVEVTRPVSAAPAPEEVPKLPEAPLVRGCVMTTDGRGVAGAAVVATRLIPHTPTDSLTQFFDDLQLLGDQDVDAAPADLILARTITDTDGTWRIEGLPQDFRLFAAALGYLLTRKAGHGRDNHDWIATPAAHVKIEAMLPRDEGDEGAVFTISRIDHGAPENKTTRRFDAQRPRVTVALVPGRYRVSGGNTDVGLEGTPVEFSVLSDVAEQTVYVPLHFKGRCEVSVKWLGVTPFFDFDVVAMPVRHAGTDLEVLGKLNDAKIGVYMRRRHAYSFPAFENALHVFAVVARGHILATARQPISGSLPAVLIEVGPPPDDQCVLASVTPRVSADSGGLHLVFRNDYSKTAPLLWVRDDGMCLIQPATPDVIRKSPGIEMTWGDRGRRFVGLAGQPGEAVSVNFLPPATVQLLPSGWAEADMLDISLQLTNSDGLVETAPVSRPGGIPCASVRVQPGRWEVRAWWKSPGYAPSLYAQTLEIGSGLLEVPVELPVLCELTLTARVGTEIDNLSLNWLESNVEHRRDLRGAEQPMRLPAGEYRARGRAGGKPFESKIVLIRATTVLLP